MTIFANIIIFIGNAEAVTPLATTAVHCVKQLTVPDTVLSEREGRKVLTTLNRENSEHFIAKKKTQAAVKKVAEEDDVVASQRGR